MSRRLLATIAALTAAAAAATWWWARVPGPAHRDPDVAASTTAAPRGLLLVTIDTLRADRVGIYGHGRARTPAFDTMARAGVRFARAFAAAPITLPSHASLLTGLNPPAHGARHNGLRMRDDVPTIATVLEGRGFRTGAFVSAFPLDKRFGLSRGFETYDDQLPRAAGGKIGNERRGSATVDAALAWLATHRSQKFFLWVHLFEPHAPYGDPPPGVPPAPVLDRYDAEIAEADRQVARLLDALGPDRASTLVAVTADHGEAFGEHGEIGHSVFVYDTTLRVPLALAGPGVPADGRVVEGVVGLIDVVPTLLGLLREPALDADGVDLRRTFDGTGAPPLSRPLYAESFAPLLDFGWSPLQALRDGRWKYIAAPKPELFDVSQDAGEERNLVAAETGEATRLAARVARLAPATLSAASPSDREAASRLGALGYVSSSRAATVGDRPDPKDRRTIAARLAEVTSGEVSSDRLVPVLEGVLRDDPRNPQAQMRLGVALVERGECARAERHLRDAIASGLPSADPFIALAYCYRARGDVGGARRTLTEAQRLERDNPVVIANLGLLAFDQGQVAEAIPLLRAALQGDADLHEARFVLARALARSGQRDAARAEAETLLARLPSAAPQRAEVERLVAALR